MADTLKLMAVLAHPDDESMGFGGTLAYYAAQGVETYLITATRGERGWFGKKEDYPGKEALGKIREEELAAATKILGIKETRFLDYVDGDLDQADADEAIRRIVSILREIRPQVVMSFDNLGAYGHPDHIAISQMMVAASIAAADPGYAPEIPYPTHRVDKGYYLVNEEEQEKQILQMFGDLSMTIDGVERRGIILPDWAITTVIDAPGHWQQVWDAISQHRSQLPEYDRWNAQSEDVHRALWERQNYYRVFSSVNVDRKQETDLFEGLR